MVCGNIQLLRIRLGARCIITFVLGKVAVLTVLLEARSVRAEIASMAWRIMVVEEFSTPRTCVIAVCRAFFAGALTDYLAWRILEKGSALYGMQLITV